MIGGLVLVAVGIVNAAALALIGRRHNRRHDAAREAPTEHEITYGLTDSEVSILQGALQERAEHYPDDAETCSALEQILLDQLGPETADECGWEILQGN